MERSKLVRLFVKNLGCIGPAGVHISLDNIVCLVGKNNAGKSTILKAYELARGGKFDWLRDRCAWAPDNDGVPEVQLDVHIPNGIGNVDAKWKFAHHDLLLVRSRWQWQRDGKAIRSTWDPQINDWSEDAKAGGADPVFKSRLPMPIRIGSLEDANETEKDLLALVLSPIIEEMDAQQKDVESDLCKAVATIKDIAMNFGLPHETDIKKISTEIQSSLNNVFPGLGVELAINMETPSLKLKELLTTGSSIRITDGGTTVDLAQQGSGARRALFWSLLPVHNRLVEKQRQAKAQAKLPKNKAKAALQVEENAEDDIALPGFILLIDEPENALHPMAARAAQEHLYELANDPNWQVILATHSPYFVNPFADHTTIIRVERAADSKGAITPKTYRADDVAFDPEIKPRLRALQQMDVGFSEVFFGSYPVLVEGDSEHAAFIAAVTDHNHDLTKSVSVIRARGKALLPSLIRMLRHFKISFGVLHDSDKPYNDKGGANGMWRINEGIYNEIKQCRSEGIQVRHRYSVPDFEQSFGLPEQNKEAAKYILEHMR
jgi:putative ATP-dependent endonuclease of the OLD family